AHSPAAASAAASAKACASVRIAGPDRDHFEGCWDLQLSSACRRMEKTRQDGNKECRFSAVSHDLSFSTTPNTPRNREKTADQRDDSSRRFCASASHCANFSSCAA